MILALLSRPSSPIAARNAWSFIAIGLSMTSAIAEVAPSAEALPPLRALEEANIILNNDPGFESREQKAWRFSDWPPREKTIDRLIGRSVFYSKEEVHHGDSAVCFDLGTVGPDRYLAATQGFDAERIKPHDGRKLRLSAWVYLARGPDVYTASLGIRQWGKPGKPPVSATSIRMQAMKGKWSYYERTFTLRLGETRRGDFKVSFKTPPAGQDAPVCYVDDCKLEVLSDPALDITVLAGATIAGPDRLLPFRVKVDAAEWKQGLRHLRWDVTSEDGRRSLAQSTVELSTAQSIVEATLPRLPYGRYGLRVSVGSQPNERTYEVLNQFRYARGPFADE